MSPSGERSVLALFSDIEGAIVELKKAEAQLDASSEGTEAYQIAFNAILYCLVVVGEAVNALPDEVKAKEPDIPWRRVVDMRNILTHQYFSIDAGIIESTVDEPLEALRDACARLRNSQ